MSKKTGTESHNLKPSPWWDRETHTDRRPALLARARIKAAVRQWFESEGFIEVDTTCLQVSPGAETHLHAFKTELIDPDLTQSSIYLHTSPEFACKKLLAAGERKIFTFAPVFRNRERGPLHHPEFTMLEWYRAGETYEKTMADCTNLIKIAARETPCTKFTWRGQTCDPTATPHEITVTDAFEKYAGIDLQPSITEPDGDRDALAKQTNHIGIQTQNDDTWSDIFSRILTTQIEPHLGVSAPTFLKDYPIQEAALAQRSNKNPNVAERFELYCCGVELANGFGELTDPVEQRNRLEAAMAKKCEIYGERFPIDDEFIAALAHMPVSSGVALGFDRLVMLATSAPRIDHVIWTPLDETHKTK